MKYRLKSTEIDAQQFDGTPAGALVVFAEFPIPGGKFVPDQRDLAFGRISIPSISFGVKLLTYVSRGDWIVKDAMGVYSCCRADVFARTYELVTEMEVIANELVEITPQKARELLGWED